MALRMAAPWKDPKTGVWYLRQRTPRELSERLQGSTVNLPIFDQLTACVTVGEVVKVSLRTKDDKVAKQRHSLADAALRAFWAQASATQRDDASHGKPNAPEADTAGEIVDSGNHAGSLLSAPMVPRRIRDPGPHPVQIQAIQAAWAATAAGVSTAAGVFPIKRRLSGDTNRVSAVRDPRIKLQPHTQQTPSKAVPIIEVLDLWANYKNNKNENLSRNTLLRYEASVTALAKFFPGRDVRTITSDDFYSWTQHRRDVQKIHPKTINSNDLVAISSLFKWAMKREGGRLLDYNPAKGERLDEPRSKIQRERTFRDAEIEAILRAALAVTPSPKRDFNADAKRWCPWLAAYSGARISELTSLTAADIWEEQGISIMHFSNTKNLIPRSVPIHEHLIAQGFLDFVKQSGPGPLFYDPQKHGLHSRTPPHEIRSRKVADWVRATAKLDPHVDPNHGWRHTFKSRALGLMDERVRDAIVGHQPSSVARRYETPSIPQMAEAMAAFPRYNI